MKIAVVVCCLIVSSCAPGELSPADPDEFTYQCPPNSPAQVPLLTERAAREVYFRAFREALTREGKSGPEVTTIVADAANHLMVREGSVSWDIVQRIPGTENLVGGGGFGVILRKCDGRILHATYVR